MAQSMKPEGKLRAVFSSRLMMEKVHAALQKAHPGKRKFTILEDNDPAGNQSRKGRDAKRECHLTLFRIPKRSPDLNVFLSGKGSRLQSVRFCQRFRCYWLLETEEISQPRTTI